MAVTLKKIFIIFLFTISQCTLATSDELRNDIRVDNTAELYRAVKHANQAPNGTHILLSDGHYPLTQRIELSGSHITLGSKSGDPSKVILSGSGMQRTNNAEILIDVSGSHIKVTGLTLEKSANHLVQVRAEKNADHFSLDNCVLRDAYEQLLKVSSNPKTIEFADFGSISNCLFEYSAGIGPQFYIGGVDAHRSRNWRIANNTFKNIASPSEHVAEHAIHFWRQSADITVIGNTIINCDRGIGFGLGESLFNQTKGGLIANNQILSGDKHPFADAGIILEASPNVQVINNQIHLDSSYPNAIEYRFGATQNVLIKDNITNKAIVSRDGGQAELSGNQSANKLIQIKDSLRHFIQRF